MPLTSITTLLSNFQSGVRLWRRLALSFLSFAVIIGRVEGVVSDVGIGLSPKFQKGMLLHSPGDEPRADEGNANGTEPPTTTNWPLL